MGKNSFPQRLPTIPIPAIATDFLQEAIKHFQIEQLSHWLSAASLNDFWIAFYFYCFV